LTAPRPLFEFHLETNVKNPTRRLFLAAAIAVLPLLTLFSNISCDFGKRDAYLAGYVEVPNPNAPIATEGASWDEAMAMAEADIPLRVGAVWKNDAILYRLGGLENKQSEAVSVYASGRDVFAAGHCEGKATVWKNGTILYQLPENIEISEYGDCAEDVQLHVSEGDIYVLVNGKVYKNGLEHTTGGSARQICVVGKDLYVVSDWRNAKSNRTAEVWKNGAKLQLGTGKYLSVAMSVCAYGDDVYVAGGMVNSPREKAIAVVWKNGAALQLGNGKKKSLASSVCVSGNDLYVSGIMEDDSGPGLEVTGSTRGERWWPDRGVVWKNGAVLLRHTNGSEDDKGSIQVLGEDVYVSRRGSVYKNDKELPGVRQFCISGKDVYLYGHDFDENHAPTIWKNDKVLYRIKDFSPSTWNGALFVK